MAIIITRDGKDARKIEKAPVGDEAYLQRYVAQNPDSLPLDEVKDDPRLLVIGREFQTSSGPIDVLAVDRDGDLYVIETKLFKNPDKRLVVAQMLDYGAALWTTYGDGNEFVAEVDAFIARGPGAGGLNERLKATYEMSDEEAAAVRDRMRANLSQGSIRFVVLMDQLHERLRDLILFINQKSRFDIYAVEMDFYRHAGLEIVIPRLFGAEVKKEVASGQGGGGGARKSWSPEEFFAELAANTSPAVADFGKSVLGEAGNHGLVVDWKSSGPLLKYEDPARDTFFTFGGFDRKGGFEHVSRLYDRCEELGLPEDIWRDYFDALVGLIPGAARERVRTKSGREYETVTYSGGAEPLRSLMVRREEWLVAVDKARSRIQKASMPPPSV